MPIDITHRQKPWFCRIIFDIELSHFCQLKKRNTISDPKKNFFKILTKKEFACFIEECVLSLFLVNILRIVKRSPFVCFFFVLFLLFSYILLLETNHLCFCFITFFLSFYLFCKPKTSLASPLKWCNRESRLKSLKFKI